MFTFSELGQAGRFGNQLFQIAATVGMAAKHGVECVFPVWPYAPLFKTPIPQTSNLRRADVMVRHDCFHFMDICVTAREPCLIDLMGYFQSEKYFMHCVERVRAYFEPSSIIATGLGMGYGDQLRNGRTCIIVVRRGDYLKLQHRHPVQTTEFYAAAMDMFDADTTFFVTSDDVAWCRESIRAKNVVFLPEAAWFHNFCLGTMCQDAIISNTTFGWWIAYLNKNPAKRVVAAKKWFGPANAHLDTRDLLPPGWLTL